MFVIAEVGINHGGRAEVAHRYIDVAADAGADAVKFQTINPSASYVPGTPSYAEFTGKTLDEDEYRALVRHGEARGVAVFTTPGDFPSLEICRDLRLPAIKISSGLLTNTPLVNEAARLGVPLIISTGASYLWEIARVVYQLEERGTTDVVVLHCVSVYPSRPELVNLRAMAAIAAAVRRPVGYSDHTLDATAPLAAVALGACMIEKHFTLDRTIAGADHHLSLDPAAFADMVRQIRACEQLLGSGIKEPHAEEMLFRVRYRRRLVATGPIAKGETISAAMVGLMRAVEPIGLAPEFYDIVVGLRASRDIRAHEPIVWDCVAGADE